MTTDWVLEQSCQEANFAQHLSFVPKLPEKNIFTIHSQMKNFVKIFEIQVAGCTRFLVIFHSQLFFLKEQKISCALN